MGVLLRSIIDNKNYINDISKCFVFLFNKDVKFCFNLGFFVFLFVWYFYLLYEVLNLFYLVEVYISYM